MAQVGNRGFIDDGSSNLTVAGSTTTTSLLNNPLTLAGSGTVSISSPAFYYVPASGASGMGYFTGSVPAPSSCPGSMLMITDTYGLFNWLLTGSAYQNGKALFVRPSGSFPGIAVSALGGGTVSIQPSGSIMMMSDGFRWCIIGGTGSFSLAGNNL